MKWLHGKNLFLICAALMILIRNHIIIKVLVPKPWNYAGIVLILTGLSMAIHVVKLFKKRDTEIHTFKSPRKLITTGLFKFSRNPVYLGFVFSLIGLWILLGTLLPIIGCILFILLCNFWQIPYEERAMAQQFGQGYENYKSSVRRWF